jgi:hypothetical protein
MMIRMVMAALMHIAIIVMCMQNGYRVEVQLHDLFKVYYFR